MTASHPSIDYSAWIGRTEEAVDELSRNLLKRIAATFGENAPPLANRCLRCGCGASFRSRWPKRSWAPTATRHAAASCPGRQP